MVLFLIYVNNSTMIMYKYTLLTRVVTPSFTVSPLWFYGWHGLPSVVPRPTNCSRWVNVSQACVCCAHILTRCSSRRAHLCCRSVWVGKTRSVTGAARRGHLLDMPGGLMLLMMGQLLRRMIACMKPSETSFLSCVAAWWWGSWQIRVGDVIRATVQCQWGLGKSRVESLGWSMWVPQAAEQRMIHLASITTNPQWNTPDQKTRKYTLQN